MKSLSQYFTISLFLVVMISPMISQDMDLDGDIIMDNYSLKGSNSTFSIYQGPTPKIVLHSNGELDITKRLNMPSSSKTFQLSAEGSSFTLRVDGEYKLGYYGPNVWGPTVTNQMDLGSAGYRWRRLYVNGASIVNGSLSAKSLNIIGASSGTPIDIRSNSSAASPHISLYEEGTTDFTRIKMRNNAPGDNYWNIAARVAVDGAQEDAIINFFYSDATFNVFKVFGNGDAIFQGDLTANGILYPSDINLKRDIHPITKMERIYDINGYSFFWKSDTESNSQNLEFGVIAQEIQSLFPSLVKKTNEGSLAVDYNGLIPLMIEAIKAQKNQIDFVTEELESIKKLLK